MVFGGVYLVYSSLFCDMLMCSLTVGCMFLLFSWLCLLLCFCCFFFFQAEDGIRDADVTGVQTCALPISAMWVSALRFRFGIPTVCWAFSGASCCFMNCGWRDGSAGPGCWEERSACSRVQQIGRASCRERVEVSVLEGSV